MAQPGDADPRRAADDGFDVFGADAEVGRDLAAVDWAATALGPPAGWQQSLRTAVSILLSSRFSMWMAWGPQLTFFCNDAYRRATLDRKYPWALGRPAGEVWAEIWPDIGPRIDTVLTTARATWDEALLLFLERSGYAEESYHTFSYSPLRDDGDAVVGMLCVVSEETDRVIGERRMATLRDLGSEPSAVRTEQQMLAFASRQLARNAQDLPFALTYLFEDGAGARLAEAVGIRAGHPAAPAVLPLDDTGPWPARTLARGGSVLVELDGAAFADLPTGAWQQPPARALAVPLLRQGGGPYGFLVAGLNRYRPLDEAYRGFVELTAGHLAAAIASARSYRAQQRRAEELAELDRAKTTFFSNISHEFRTPLTLIMGPVQELHDRLPEDDTRDREDLETIRRNGLRLGKLVNSLLDFSRIEAGRMQARFEPVDLAAATAELAGVFRSAVEKAGLVFDVDCPRLDEPVYLDRGMWEKVVLNLLSNALKFTFEGSVRVAVRAQSGHALVTVADTGIGVSEQELPRLFERFHRIEDSRSRSTEGSGIGLALVKELIGLNGGTIAAESTLGSGTAFTVSLPFGHEHLPADALVPAAAAGTVSATADPFIQEALRWLPAEQSASSEAASEPEREPVPEQLASGLGAEPGDALRVEVLIADDNADMRDYLSRLLRGAGHRVRVVGDGQAALEAAETRPPDLIISDVMMPRLDGLELVAALRRDARTAGIPVLLLSARAGQEASIEGLDAGADDYLVKPFSAAELLARVRANVQLARLRTHQARWRTALVDSLQEAFFVCDESGTVTEINAAFERVLGYGPAGLPYEVEQPWWPAANSDPQAHRLAAEAFGAMIGEAHGTRTAPVTHRDGHRLWVDVTYSHVQDPDTGRHVIVGTLRDVTAERYAVQRESAVAALSMRLSEAASLRQALAAALDEFRSLWRARDVLAAVFPARGAPTLTSADSGVEPSWEAAAGEHRAALTATREGQPLSPRAIGTGVGVTLEHPHGPMAIWLDLGGDRPVTVEDRTLLTVLASHLAQGLARAHQIDQQRETALALQRAILGPADLPAGFAVRYEPAARPLEVGGDWYDTVPLPAGRIGIVVGDCVGRGLEAAAVMGQLRSACRALLLQDPRPERVLAALDQFAAGIPGAACTTVFCGVLDPETGELVYSSAGHPPGILVSPDGTTHLLDQARFAPLAVLRGRERGHAQYTVPPHATLLLYTDGLVERRRRSLTEGIDQAGHAVRDGRDIPVDELANDVMTRLAPSDGYDDDVALLLYRHPAPLELSFPADTAQLAPVRNALRAWLAKCDLPPQVVQSVLVAVGEAFANAIEHGYRNTSGQRIYMRAEALVDRLKLTVSDNGRWKPSQPDADSHRGRGLALMHAMMQHVTVTPGADGTTVAMDTRIPR